MWAWLLLALHWASWSRCEENEERRKETELKGLKRFTGAWTDSDVQIWKHPLTTLFQIIECRGVVWDYFFFCLTAHSQFTVKTLCVHTCGKIRSLNAVNADFSPFIRLRHVQRVYPLQIQHICSPLPYKSLQIFKIKFVSTFNVWLLSLSHPLSHAHLMIKKCVLDYSPLETLQLNVLTWDQRDPHVRLI